MYRISAEVKFWSAEQVTALLDEAVGAVEASQVPAELHEAAFEQACGLLAQRHRELEKITLNGPAMAIPRTQG